MFLEKFARKLGQTENLLRYGETGAVPAASFTGSPRKYTVNLANVQPTATYAVAVTGHDARAWTVESRTSTGFIINSNAAEPLTGPVFWNLGGNI